MGGGEVVMLVLEHVDKQAELPTMVSEGSRTQ